MSEIFIKRIISANGSIELSDGECTLPEAWREPLCSVLYGGETDGGLILGTASGDIALARRNGELRAADCSTGEPVAKITRENAGEELFGVSEDVFRRGEEGFRSESLRLSELAEAGRRECARLEDAMMQSRKSARLSALSEMHGLKEQRTAAEKRHTAAAERLEKSRAAIKDSFFGENDPELVRFEADSDVSKSLALKKLTDRKLSNIPQTLMLTAGLILALLTAWVLPYEAWAWCFSVAGVLCFASALLFLRTGRLRMDAGEARADRNAILEKYNAASEEDICALRDQYMTLCAEHTEALREEKSAAQELLFVELSIKSQSADAVTRLDFASGSSEAVQIAKKLSDARALCEDTAQRLQKIRKYPLLCGSTPPTDAQDRQIIILI